MSVEITTLPSGLIVATDRVETVESVALGAFVDIGARHESAQTNGIAHLIEHMFFKGTARRNAQQIAAEIEDVGGDLNAFTSREGTAYVARVLQEDTRLALDLVSDMLTHASFDAEELAREAQVVVQEIGQADDTPDDIIHDRLQQTAFPDQALGRPVLGTVETVTSFQAQQLKDYVAGHYGAGATVVSAAGKLEHARVVDTVAELFKDLPPAQRVTPEPGRYAGGDAREERDLEQLHLMLGFPGTAHTHADYYAANVLSLLLGGGMSSRLFQEIREKRGLVYSIYSYTASFDDCGLFAIYAGTGEDDVAELVPVLCDQLCDVTRNVTEAEVARARAQVRAKLTMGLERMTARSEGLASNIQIHGRHVPIEEIRAKVDAVTPQDVMALAARMFAAKPSLAALGPLGKVESYERICGRLPGGAAAASAA